MISLNQSEFKNLKRTLNKNNITCPTFVYSILDGYIQGTVYVDSTSQKSVLIGTKSGIYFVGGEVDNLDFNNFLFELYRYKKNNKSRFTLFSSSSKWNCAIMSQLKEEIKQRRRFSFNYNFDKEIDKTILQSSEYSIKKINAEIIKNSLEFNEAYYKEYWGSTSNFLKNGFGFSILHNERVISECSSIFSSQEFAEIDIFTHKDYRGKGLANIIATSFIEYCLKNSIVPKWDCDVTNESSINLAGKLGFVEPVEYSIFVYKN